MIVNPSRTRSLSRALAHPQPQIAEQFSVSFQVQNVSDVHKVLCVFLKKLGAGDGLPISRSKWLSISIGDLPIKNQDGVSSESAIGAL